MDSHTPHTFFRDGGLIPSPRWPQLFLFLSPECWDYRQVPLNLPLKMGIFKKKVYNMLGAIKDEEVLFKRELHSELPPPKVSLPLCRGSRKGTVGLLLRGNSPFALRELFPVLVFF